MRASSNGDPFTTPAGMMRAPAGCCTRSSCLPRWPLSGQKGGRGQAVGDHQWHGCPCWRQRQRGESSLIAIASDLSTLKHALGIGARGGGIGCVLAANRAGGTYAGRNYIYDNAGAAAWQPKPEPGNARAGASPGSLFMPMQRNALNSYASCVSSSQATSRARSCLSGARGCRQHRGPTSWQPTGTNTLAHSNLLRYPFSHVTPLLLKPAALRPGIRQGVRFATSADQQPLVDQQAAAAAQQA